MVVKSPRGKYNTAFHKRMVVLAVFLFLFFGYIACRLFVMEVVDGKVSRALADDQHSVIRKLFPVRGEIKISDKYSTDSYTVATNVERPLVYVVPQDIQNASVAAESLSSVLGLDPTEILVKISDKDRHYVPLKKQLTEDEVNKIKALDLLGVNFDYETYRYYPQGQLLSQVTGFVGYNKDNQKVGLYGLEKYFESSLAGKQGVLKEEKDTAGAWIFGSTRELDPAEDGSNLLLTIDKTLQYKAESVIADAVVHNEADSGTVIIMNPKTGAVLAMASYPTYNPNEYNKVKTEDQWVFSNRATMAGYEPGSVFKPLTMAAAIDEGKVGPDTTYNDTGEVVVAKYHIKNSDNAAHGIQTMTQVLEQSLNTGAIFAKDQIGNVEFLKYVKKFGFGKETGIELPQLKGNLDNLRSNIEVNFDTATFGQGITVTPIQLMQAFTALANKGKMVQPYIVQSKIYSDGRVDETKTKVLDQVVSEQTANTLSAMLVQVVENGHGKKAGVPGYYIAGKTGTAQVPNKNGKPGYEENNNIGTFIGYGPVEDPQFLMMVRVDHPRDVTFAETTAAPAWGQLAQFILSYYNIPPTRH
jgi:cell division protein FtsI/penicillin-binding protein 2